MIIGISNVHTGDLVLPGVLVVGLFWGAYLGKRLIDLWIDSMRRHSTMDQHAHDAHRLAETGRAPYAGFYPPEVAPEDEPSWPGKASLELVPREQAVVLGGDPARFGLAGILNAGFGNPYPADATETSGRHARVDGDDTATGLMPAVVDDERALAVVASVSGVDGAS